MSNFVVKENSAFRLRVSKHECLRPEGLKHIEFVHECLDKDGNVDFTSTYQFFLTEDEIAALAKEIVK